MRPHLDHFHCNNCEKWYNRKFITIYWLYVPVIKLYFPTDCSLFTLVDRIWKLWPSLLHIDPRMLPSYFHFLRCKNVHILSTIASWDMKPRSYSFHRVQAKFAKNMDREPMSRLRKNGWHFVCSLFIICLFL